MQHDALAQVYARSIFEMARDAGGRAKIEEINDELEQLVEITRSDAAFATFLASPVIDRAKRGDTLRRIFDGRISDLVLRFLLVLNDKGRLNRIESIYEAHDHLVQEEFGRVEVDVYTAAKMGDDARAMIRERIQQALGKEPVMHAYTDNNMIGGVKLRIGDQLIDGSVQTQLRRMRGNLLTGGGWKLREKIDRVIENGESDA